MTTAAQAFAIIKAHIIANKPAKVECLRFQNEDGDPLPDEAAPFIYTEFLTDRGSIAAFGGGRMNNRYRNPARIEAYIFVKRGDGNAVALEIAEQFATIFRSYRDADISCFDASVLPGGDGADLKPKGITSRVSNYFYACVEVSLFYDLIG